MKPATARPCGHQPRLKIASPRKQASVNSALTARDPFGVTKHQAIVGRTPYSSWQVKSASVVRRLAGRQPRPHGVVPTEDLVGAISVGKADPRERLPHLRAVVMSARSAPRRTPSECLDKAEGCSSYFAGHLMHWIHARHIGESPWGWRDGVIAPVLDGWIVVSYLDGGEVRVWHHEQLPEAATGTLVRVHEEYHALGGPFGWLNVITEGGLGPVPEPAEPGLWSDEMTVGVVDLSTGRALALDHLDQEDEA
jgi:hypothetical protein